MDATNEPQSAQSPEPRAAVPRNAVRRRILLSELAAVALSVSFCMAVSSIAP